MVVSRAEAIKNNSWGLRFACGMLVSYYWVKEHQQGLPSKRHPPMTTILCNVSALAVASIFYTWRLYYAERLQKHQEMLRERVAYMLWVMANSVK